MIELSLDEVSVFVLYGATISHFHENNWTDLRWSIKNKWTDLRQSIESKWTDMRCQGGLEDEGHNGPDCLICVWPAFHQPDYLVEDLWLRVEG